MQVQQSFYPFQLQPQNSGGRSSPTVAVIGQQFCAAYPVQLTIQRRPISFSGGDFNVFDSLGNLLLTAEGRAFSLRDIRILRDQAGNPLLTLRKKLLSLHQRWEAYRGEESKQENLLFTARTPKVFQLRTSLNVSLSGSAAQTDFKVKGSFFQRSCTIYQGATIIAQMRRKYTVSQFLLGRDTFLITVYPGIDHAFTVALVLILHEIIGE